MSKVATVGDRSATVARRRLRHDLARGRLAVAISIPVALALLAPLVMLALDARDAGWGEIHRVLFRDRSAMLLRNTVVLGVLVVALASTLGVAAAWCTERLRLPGRRIWTVLLVMPVAIPDFVVGSAWHSIAPTLTPLLAATIVMTLGTYPLVYLPSAAALRRLDPAMQDTAHSLGVGQVRTFLRVTLPLMRTAVLGGCVLVALTVLSEYGAFEIVRYQTFTTEIFTEFQFDPQAAAALSVPLVALGLIILGGDALLPRRVAVRTPHARAPKRSQLGLAGPAVLLALSVLVLLGVGVPIGTLLYWIAQSQHSTLPAAASLGAATASTVAYSALGAGVAVVASLPVALMGFRRSTAARLALERSTYVTQALPGIVIALSLVYFAAHFAFAVYQSSVLLIAAYVIMHFPLALVCVKASVAQAPAQLSDVAQSLGSGPVRTFRRVTLPLLVPGLVAGFCLVFLTAVTELTATLVLAPIGVQTLATQFWAYEREVAYGAAAPYALMITAIALIPGTLLALWFDRERFTRPAPA